MGKAKRLKHAANPSKKPKPSHHPYAKPSPKPAKPSKTSKPSTTIPTHLFSTVPFTPHDAILLIGEGDFSFSRTLISTHGAASLTSTSYDTQPTLYAKYASAASNITYITTEGSRVIFSVDATKLHADKRLRLARREIVLPDGSVEGSGRGGGTGADTGYDFIIFNFPHTGGLSTDMRRQVRANQGLIRDFLNGAKELLHKTRGTILVTLFEGETYELWNIRNLARHVGLRVLGSWRWRWGDWPGYVHKRTLGDLVGRGGKSGKEQEEDADEGGGEGDEGEGKEEDEEAEGEGGRTVGAWTGNERPARCYAFGRQEWTGTGEENLMRLLGGAAVQPGQSKKNKNRKKGGESGDEDE